jgi:membrane-bound inhibitor of C-type lysozyme
MLRLVSLITLMVLIASCSDGPTPALPPGTPSDPADLPAAPPVVQQEDPPPGADEAAAEQHYRCDDDMELVLMVAAHRARVITAESEQELRQEPAASGVYFVGDDWQVHSKGTSALLIGPDSTRECRQLE